MKQPNQEIIDQKIIKEKKGMNWLWIILLLLLLALFAWWMFGRDSYDSDRAASTQSTETQAIAPADEAQVAVHDPEQMSIAERLNVYFADASLNQSSAMNIDAVDFASESSTPTVNDPAEIANLAQVLNRHPNSSIVLRGYADATGPDSLNDALSTQRAEAVKNLLVEHQVAADRISIEGKGDHNPIATNQDAEGRDMNRRVVLRVNGK